MKLPKYFEYITEHSNDDNALNEGSSDQKTIGFDNVNGILKIFLKFQEQEGYDTMKAVGEPEAELKLQFDSADTGIIFSYQENDYEEDRKAVLNEIRDAADEFDKAIRSILEKRNFIS